MSTFYYKATDSAGKMQSGSVEAGSKAGAVERVERMGLFPLNVSDKAPGKQIELQKIDLRDYLPANRISMAIVLDFTDKLGTLLKAGLPLAKALNLLVETTPSEPMKDVIKQVLKDVSGGNTFADSLAKHTKVFSRLYVNMVRTGEAAGVLETILENLRDYLQIRQNLKAFLVSSLIYPCILAFTGLGTVLVLVLFVLPRFQEVFDQVGMELPFVTKLLVDITAFLSDYKWVLILTLLTGGYAFKKWIDSKDGRLTWDTFKLRLPVLGSILTEIEVNRFSNALGILLRSSVSLLDAMNIAKEIADNMVFRNAMDPMIKGVKKGDGMAKSMAETKIFPRMAVHLVTVGEETGTLGDMFWKISHIYQQNLEKTIKRFLAMFEPIMILIMFVVVGFIVAAMLLAVTSISQGSM